MGFNMLFGRKKTLWQRHQKWIVSLGVVLLLGYGVNQYYENYHQEKTLQASALYDKMIMEARNPDKTKAREYAESLINTYPKTPYAALSALFIAKFSIEKNELEPAVNFLQMAMEKEHESPIYYVAASRLARIFAEQNKLEDALKLLESKKVPDDYVTLFEETKGDIYLMQNQTDKAKEAYKIAIQSAPPQTPVMRLQLKFSDLGGTMEGS